MNRISLLKKIRLVSYSLSNSPAKWRQPDGQELVSPSAIEPDLISAELFKILIVSTTASYMSAGVPLPHSYTVLSKAVLDSSSPAHLYSGNL